MVLLNFVIGKLRSEKLCDLPIINQWETIEMRLFWTIVIQNTIKHRFTDQHGTLNRKMHQWTGAFSLQWSLLMSLRSSQVRTCTGQIMILTFGQIFQIALLSQLIVYSTRLDDKDAVSKYNIAPFLPFKCNVVPFLTLPLARLFIAKI